MRIFLGNPPWNETGYYGVRAGSRWPHLECNESRYMPFPFFLAYTSSLLEKNGYHPLLVDAIAEKLSINIFIHKIEKFDPELVILEVSTPSFINDLEIVDLIRKSLGKKVLIALCGPNDLMVSAKFLQTNPQIDYILRGEYEITVLELVSALENKQDLGKIDGLHYRDQSGNVIINKQRALISNIDDIPWPSRHQLPMMNYYDEAGSIAEPGAQMWASRGCPHMCIFCVWPQLVYGGANYRVRNPADVADEMAWLINTYGFKSIYFDDDTFNIGKPRMLKLCEEIHKKNLNIPWAIMARADGMDREVLEKMRAAGLESVKYGVESGDQTVLDGSGKNLSLETTRDVIKITRELGIQYHLTFTFGLPGETRETAKKTIDLALELDPHTIQFSICTPMPGSKYFDMAKEKGYLLDVDWSNYTGFTSAVIRTDELSSSDLEEILAEAEEAWSKRNYIPKTWKERLSDNIKSTGNKFLSRLLSD